MLHRIMGATGLAVALAASVGTAAVAAHDSGDGHDRGDHGARTGTVYTITNAAAGNAVVAYSRWADGSLSPLGTYATGGDGTGAGLGSQGAVSLSADGDWLATVDAGSNDVALFRVGHDGRLLLSDRIASGGTDPISVTIHDNVVYVLDAGGDGNIAGFRVWHGQLHGIWGSSRALSGAGTSPEEIAFSPDGRTLVVTEKAGGDLVTYRVNPSGVAGGPQVFASAGAAPYGFAFDGRGRFFVTEAAASAVSSYSLSWNGTPSVITASLTNGQAAACWLAVTPNGRFAFSIDAHNAAISSYRIHRDGSLTLVNGTAALEGASSIPLLDASISRDGRFLYVVDGGTNAIDSFRIGSDGSLVALGSTGSFAAGWGGLAAS